MTTRGYKRSWKNLLINKRYQLRFTLFMVGLALVLMALLGWWVVRVADEATTVAKSRVRGNPCPELPALPATRVLIEPGEMRFDEPGAGGGSAAAPAAGANTGSAADPTTGAGAGAGAPTLPAPAAAGAPAAGAPAADAPAADAPAADAPAADPPAGGHTISLDEPSMRLEPIPVTLPPEYTAELLAHHECVLARAGKLADLDRGHRRIVLVLFASAALVIVGLVLFGIKMTHRVAGPLYKVTLYLAKLRDGRYDKVYDLRRGDQLVEFYEHFRQAHAGVVKLEEADRDRIAAALDAATADGVLERSPEAGAAAAELRAILERKEKALGHQS